MFNPQVSLINIFNSPYENAVATARTCYNSRLITTEEVGSKPEMRDRIAASIYEAGHHTTLQHTHVQFALSNVSRYILHAYFHTHSYYNCVSGDTFITPYFRVRGQSGSAKTIKELYLEFQDDFKRPYLLRSNFRSIDSEGNIIRGRIKTVVSTGVKPVYEVKTRLGYSVKSTLDHRYMASDGTFNRLGDLRVGDFIKVNGIEAYKDKVWLHQKYNIENLSQEDIGALAGVSKHTVRTWVRKHGLQKEMGSWSKGQAPPNKGKTLHDYEPLRRSSAKLKGKKSHQRSGELNSNWKGDKTKAPRDRAKLWYKAEVCVVCGSTKEDRRIERHHRDENPYNNTPENILILCSYCHKQAHSPHGLMYRVINDTLESITYVGEEETYDLEMVNPEHNFVANGLVVHNSEQVSQRFVHIKADNTVKPNIKSESYQNIFDNCIKQQILDYELLSEKLFEVASREYYRIFPARVKKKDIYDKEVKKKSQEVARYVLPLGTAAHLYHTIPLLTLLRYQATADQAGLGLEARLIVNEMVRLVLERDPQLEKVFKDPPAELVDFESQYLTTSENKASFNKGFDNALNGYTSKLVDYSVNAQDILSTSLHEVLGLPYGHLNEAQALKILLDPSVNKYLTTTLNTSSQSPITRCLQHVKYTFKRRISHTADSQDQRHRMVPGSRPILLNQVTDRPDYITPTLILQDAECLAIYEKSMSDTWRAFNRLYAEEPIASLYLLPNAVAVRYTESGDLLNYHHKWKSRLCYTAQEEIWAYNLEEVQQISSVHPLIGYYILPPCGLRKMSNTKPYCPEGSRYCGVPVWAIGKHDYERVI